MDMCEHCSEMLLDYLYDLLDAAESAEVRAHLAECATCRANLAAAESQQRLIARAARLYQSVPAFLSPAPVPAMPSSSAADTIPLNRDTLLEPATAPPRPAPARRAARPAAWLALAASVLLAVGIGFGLYRTGVTERELTIQTTQRQAKEIDTQYAALAQEYVRKTEALPAKLLKQELHVQVAGPAVYRREVGNSIFVNTTSLAGKAVPADVMLRVTEEKSGKEVYKTKAADTFGEVALTLPPHLGAGKPGEKWQLEIEAASMWACEKIQQPLVVAPTNYVTQLVTNKPEYETGELLFFRTLTLEQFTLQPPEQTFALNYSLVNANGTIVKKLSGPAQANGVGGGEFALTEDLPDGVYSLRVEDAAGAAPYNFAPQTFSVLIRQALTPKIAFDKNLSPGAKVNFAFQGGPSNAHQPMTVTLNLKEAAGKAKSADKDNKSKVQDGIEQLRADALGNVKGTFTVPKDVPVNAQAELEFQVHDGKLNQKFVQPVPVVVPGWNVAIFPEGGNLIAGLPNHIYCQVTTPGTKTAAIQGELLDALGKMVATVALTPQQSKEPSQYLAGAFTFTPQVGATYKLRVGLGNHAATEKTLPAVRTKGLTLAVANPVDAEKTPLRLTLHATEANYPVLVVAACRGQIVGQQLAMAQPQGSALELPAVAGTNGVIRLTVYQPTAKGLVPLAERLVYRAPEKNLTLSFAAKKHKLAPGQKAEMDLLVLNENRQLAKSNVLALVVDESAAAGKESAAQLNLPAYFYLTGQVQTAADLENAGFLLGPDQAARQALDCFLAIQGWRTFVPAPGNHAIITETTKAVTTPVDMPALFWRDNLDAAQARYEKTLTTLTAALRVELASERDRLQAQQTAARDRHAQAVVALQEFENQTRLYMGMALTTALLVTLVLALAFFAAGLWRVARSRPTARNSFAGAFASLAVCLAIVGVAAFFRADSQQANGLALTRASLGELPALPELPAAKQVAQHKLPNLSVLINNEHSALAKSDKQLATNDSLGVKIAGAPGKDKDGAGSTSKGAAADSKKDEAKQLALSMNNTYFMKKSAEPQAAAKATNVAFGQNQALAKTARFQNAQVWQDQFMNGCGKGGTYGTTMQGGNKPAFAPPVPVAPGVSPSSAPPPLQQNFPAPPAAGGAGGFAGPQGAGTYFAEASNYARQFAYEQAQLEAFHPDTLLWYPNLQLNKGSGTISFDLPPYSATYRVYLIGNDDAGRLGYFEGAFEVKAK